MIGKTIYLVEKTTGDYEDRFTEVIVAKTTRESAEQFIKEQEKLYELIEEIDKSWSKWHQYLWEFVEDVSNPTLFDEVEDKFMGKEDNFIEYIKTYFPEDFKTFGESRLRFAFDLEERGLLRESFYYTIQEVVLEV